MDDLDDDEYWLLPTGQQDLRAQEPMRQRHKVRTNPTPEDRKVRHRNRRATAGGDVQKRAELVRALSKASSFSEQERLLDEIATIDQGLKAKAAQDRELDLADTVVRQTLNPTRVHEHHTAATDWLGTEDTPATDWHPRVVAEASAWYGRVPAMVKQDAGEYGIQAQGMARRVAGPYGVLASQAEAAFLEYAAYLNKDAASGLDQIQQTIDGNNQPKTTPLPTEVFDNFAPDVDPVNAGVSGTETSDRAPLIQEIVNGGSGMDGGAPEKPGGHSTGDELSWAPPSGMQADTAPGWSDGDPGTPEEQGGHRTSSLSFTPGMAISHTMTMDDYRAQQAQAARTARKAASLGKCAGCGTDLTVGNAADREGKVCKTCASKHASRKDAASGLPMIQETVDANNQPHTPTPIPPDVAFPLDGDMQQEWTTDGTGNAHPGGNPAAPVVPGHKSGTRKRATSDDDPYCALCGGPIMSARSINSDLPAGWTHVEQPGTWTHPTSSDLHPPIAPTGSGDEWKYHSSMQSDEDHPPVPHDSRSLADEEARTARKNQDLLRSLQEENRTNKAFDEITRGFHESRRKQADMFGGGDAPHAVVQPNVANTPATTPPPATSGGSSAGAADARAGEAPTFSDNSSAVPAPAQQYAKGYASVDQTTLAPAADVPASMAGPGNGITHAGAKISSLITTASEREHADFRKGYGYASRWKPGTRLVTVGTREFEAGIYAGISDNPQNQGAFVEAHRTASKPYPALAARIDRHKAVTARLVAKNEVPSSGLYLLASTSIDLNTMAPNTTPAADGSTPINGPGRPGPLDGQQGAAAPGGPAPYNGAQPFGTPVVPGAGQAPEPANPADALLGSGNMSTNNQVTAAQRFRRTVQSNLLRERQGAQST